MSRLEQFFSNLILKVVLCRQKLLLSRSKQRRDSLGATTKVPPLHGGYTRDYTGTTRARGLHESLKHGVADPRLAAIPTFLLTKHRLKVKLVFE